MPVEPLGEGTGNYPDIRGVMVYDTTGNRTIPRDPDAIVEPGCFINFSFWDFHSREEELDAWNKLLQWFQGNDFKVRNVSYDSHSMFGHSLSRVPYWFEIAPNDEEEARTIESLITQDDCPACESAVQYPSSYCEECDTPLYCGRCRQIRSTARFDPRFGVFCDICGARCSDCGTVYHGHNPSCSSCDPRMYCGQCGESFPEDEVNYLESDVDHNNALCTTCYDSICERCSRFVEEGMLNEERVCNSCVSKTILEEYDDNSDTLGENIAIPSIEGRETIRLVGIEIEGANGDQLRGREGGNHLAQVLYDDGLSATYEMGGYHSQGQNRVHVERDSSVDWELVIGPLNVADPGDIRLLNSAVKQVRNLIKQGVLKLDMRAGLHIHVEGQGVALHNAYNLHKLYMYNEDFLYRIGAAKWPYHRSISRTGRDASAKSPATEGKLLFAQTFSGNRYYGLSFDNYFARYLESCRCGARQYGLFDECTCMLGKCTFEFRLFNTTANPIKIHAYLALSQALVAKAISMPEITNGNRFPALDFLKKKVSEMETPELQTLKRAWEKRIRWINKELPLTDSEKESIHYCIVNSELGKVVNNAEILLEREDS